MKTLEEYIAESLQMYICEGFDIDRARKVVSFNANHQDNVDTNDYINPYIIMNDTERGEMILSLFERKDNDSERGDGNPIVYALKNKKGWRFNNPKADIFALMKRFVSVTKALNSHFDTLLVSPSTNAVNKQVFKYLRRLVDFDYAIEDFFDKIPLDEIEAECDDDCINNYAKENDENPESLQRKVTKWFKDMKQHNGGVFSYQKIPVPYRKMITNAIRLSPSVYDSIDEFEEQINGKDVLVFDDTVATGKTLSDTAEAIRATFAPKSVTFLTLFSPKASEDYSNTRVLL